MTVLKNFPEEVLNLWNNWEIRGMVLLSLLLQTILFIFGSQRKTSGRIWIRILVWSAYLSADMVATVALGNLARSQGDLSGDVSEKENNSIQAFWAPFLLLHLGGPDTITAYSIEDNELWLRHLLGLVVQVGVAFYVFSKSWGSGILTFIAIPMFIVGIVKYTERTWVLWSSCSKSLKKSSLSDFRCSYHRTRISETPQQDLQGDYLLQAYNFLDISKFMMQDLVPGIPSLIKSRDLISKNCVDGAFKVVEVELGLIYDILYTKAPLIYSRLGIILRCISSLLSVTAFITFQVKIDKHDYLTTDIAITYLLFAAAVFLEFYAFLCLVLSDWTMIWLIDKGGNGLTIATYSLIRKLTRSERWSRSISQYNLISSSIEREPPKFLEFLGIDEMMRQMHVNRKDLNIVGLQDLIFKHLRVKAQKIKEDLNVCDKNVRSKIIGQRGDGVLEREGLLKEYKWCTNEVEFSRSILVWHLATEFCYCDDMKEADAYLNKDGSNVSKEYEASRCLSEYMMYLLVIRPNMLSKGFSDDEGYLATLQDLRGLKYPRSKEYQRTLRELRGRDRGHDDEEYQRATLREMWGVKDHGPDDDEYQCTLQELEGLKDRGPDDEEYQRTLRELEGIKDRGHDDEEYQRTLRELRGRDRGHDDEEYQRATLREMWGVKDHGPDDDEYQRTLRELEGLKDRDPDDEEYQRTLRELEGIIDRGHDDEEYQRTLRELEGIIDRGHDDEEYQRTLRELEGIKDRGHDDEEYQHAIEMWGVKDHGPDVDEYQRTLRELEGIKDRGPDDEEYQRTSRNRSEIVFQGLWKTEKSVLRGGEKLARQLLSLEPKKRWEIINEVWVEMVAYAAAHCPWKEHTQQLRRGGELLTHVSLLMLHLGLSEQYEFNASDSFSELKGTKEEEEEYDQAKDKYLKGIADMLEFTLDEELIELKRKVADRKRELGRQRELELARAWASARA